MLNGNCILVGKNANVPCLALTWCGGMALLHCAFASVGKKKEKVKCGITGCSYTQLCVGFVRWKNCV